MPLMSKIWYSISQTLLDLGNIYDRSIRAFAVKLRAFGAPLCGFGKQAMITQLENWLIEFRFPVPENLYYLFSFDDYLKEIADNEKLECKTRIAAAAQLGILAGFSSTQRFALLFRIRTTGEAAIKRYASLADRFAGRQNGEHPSNPESAI
jgi:hypothetical protein